MKPLLFAALAVFSISVQAHAGRGATDVKTFATPVYEENHMQDPRQAPYQTSATPDIDWTLDTRAFCTPPTVANDCCHYVLHDDAAGKDVTYRGPKEVYGNETDARKFASALVPRMAFYFPFATDVASFGQGWLYETGDSHSSIDFSKTTVAAGTDPTMKVQAAAPGKVVSKLWDNWHGNVLVLEHTASNGTKYRTFYFHLRNGFTHDLAQAKAVPVASDSVPQVKKYNKYANLKDPSAIHWGTDAQAIPVKVGDFVQAGQFIAYSGNTGPGGAAAGLNDDGTPMDTTRANNHLHFMLAVVNPKTAGEWIYVDPFGFYGKASSGCQDVMKDNGFPRFFAPFSDSFHGIKSDLLAKYASYYPNMGAAIQTVSLFRAGSDVHAAGSFQNGAPNPYYWYLGIDAKQLSDVVKQHVADGFRPRELQVMVDAGGTPRFTAIFKKRVSEPWLTYIDMSSTDLDAHWKDLVVNQGYRMDDFSAYVVGGQKRFAAIFVKDGMPFVFYNGVDGNTYNAKFAELMKQGFANTSFSVAAFPEGERLGGIWTKPGGNWAMYYDMTSAGYQQRFVELSAQGYRLHKIQGYGNGDRYAAIWRK